MNEQSLPTPGRFRGRVTEHDLGRSSKGNVQVAIGFAYEDQDGVQHRAVYYGVFTEKTVQSEYGPLYALRNLGFDLKAMGFSEAAFAALGAKSAENPTGGALVGKEADIVVVHEEYDGKTRAKVDWVNEPGGGLMRDRLEPHEIRDAAASVRSILAGQGGLFPTTGPSTAAKPKAPSPTPSGARDLPF